MSTPSPQPADEVLDNLTPRQQAALDELVGDALADLLLTLCDSDTAGAAPIAAPEADSSGRRQISGAANTPEAQARTATPAGPPATSIIGGGPAPLSQEAPSC